jgi:hypothetical protein
MPEAIINDFGRWFGIANRRHRHFADGAQFTYLSFCHPDYTVGVGIARNLAHRTPTSGAMRHPLAGFHFSAAIGFHSLGCWFTADRELGFHPHPALKVLS